MRVSTQLHVNLRTLSKKNALTYFEQCVLSRCLNLDVWRIFIVTYHMAKLLSAFLCNSHLYCSVLCVINYLEEKQTLEKFPGCDN